MVFYEVQVWNGHSISLEKVSSWLQLYRSSYQIFQLGLNSNGANALLMIRFCVRKLVKPIESHLLVLLVLSSLLVLLRSRLFEEVKQNKNEVNAWWMSFSPYTLMYTIVNLPFNTLSVHPINAINKKKMNEFQWCPWHVFKSIISILLITVWMLFNETQKCHELF